MALKATIYKANLHIADMDRSYYHNHALTIACHPSETLLRLMVRLLAFAMYASEGLSFSRGISTDDEPDLWEKDLTDQVTHWIELGTPEENRVRKGCHRAQRMTVVSYGERTASVWWQKHANKLARFDNLEVVFIPDDAAEALAGLVERTMDIQVSIQDGEIWVGRGEESVSIVPVYWKRAGAR